MSVSAAEKKRPLAERIAGLDVKSSFRDIRDGVGGTAHGALTDQDIAAALGMMHGKDEKGRRRVAKPVVHALETYYGSHLRHEHALREAWADESETASDLAEERIRNRIACAVAVRQFAGVKALSMDEWSRLTHLKPADFEKRVKVVSAWLENLHNIGLLELRKFLAEGRAGLDTGRKICKIGQV